MDNIKKRIYRVIDRLAYKTAIRFDRISKWAYWKLLNIEKKENTNRIFLNNMGYDTDPETLAGLFDAPVERGNNHKSKEKNSNDKDS